MVGGEEEDVAAGEGWAVFEAAGFVGGHDGGGDLFLVGVGAGGEVAAEEAFGVVAEAVAGESFGAGEEGAVEGGF